jgi:peptide/nickel transport system substrate-binding protein
VQIRLASRILPVILLAPLVASCSSGGSGPQSPSNGGTVTLPIVEDPENLNPYLEQTNETNLITKAIYQDLVDVSPANQYVPVLAASLPKASADGKTITWTLKKGLRWSDGTPFTSADVVYTAKLLISGLGVSGLGWNLVTSVTAPSPYTVRLTYSRFDPAYLDQFSGMAPDGGTQGIFSERACGASGPQVLAELACTAKPVGTGPFMLSSWQRGEAVTLKRNPYYAGPGPYLDKIIFPEVPSAFVDDEMMLSGQAQALWSIDYHSSKELRASGATVVANNQWASRIEINNSQPITSDVRVRQAISMALNRAAIVKYIFDGESKPIYSNLFSITDTPTDGYDPAEADKLLTAAGWVQTAPHQPRVRHGQQLKLNMLIPSQSSGYAALAQYIQSELAAVGIGVSITVSSDQDSRVLEGQYNLALRDDGYVGDPIGFMERYYLSTSKPASDGTWDAGWNVDRYSDPQFDADIMEAQVQPNAAKREQLLLAANAVWLRDMPAVFIATYPYPDVYGRTLHGWVPNHNTSMTWDAAQWYVN